ncbi:MAG: MFS transporter [Acidobacteria bacterium]|nr:MFS transporter [Acidobacteriota bacterium]
MTAPAPTASVFSPGRRLLTVGMVLTVTLVAFESMAIATVMPLVEEDLGDLWLYGWVFSAFFLGNLVGVVVAGSAADRRRPAVPYAVGLVVFSVGLVVGGAASSMSMLVAGRLLQGLGAGAMPAVAYVCIGRGYRPEARARMFALMSTAWVVPSVAGPALAGLIGATLGWRWVFLGLLPLCGVIGLVALSGVRTIGTPEERTAEATVLRAIQVAVGAGLLLAGLQARSVVLVLALVCAGVAIMVPAFRRLTPPGTLRGRAGLPAAVLVRGLLGFGFFAADAYVPFAITTVRGMSATLGGLALTTATFTWTLASWLQARWVDRVGPRRLVLGGLLVIGGGSLSLLAVLVPSIPAWIGLVSWGIGGFGIGLAFAPLSLVTLALAAPGEEGRATAGLQLSDMLGTALGTGVAGAIVTFGSRTLDSETAGLVLVFLVAAAVSFLGAAVATGVPRRLHPT